MVKSGTKKSGEEWDKRVVKSGTKKSGEEWDKKEWRRVGQEGSGD